MIVVCDIGNVLLNWDCAGLLASLELTEAQRECYLHELFGHPDWQRFDKGELYEADLEQRMQTRHGLSPALTQRVIAASQASLVEIPRSVALLEQMAAAGLELYALSNMPEETYALLRQKPLFRYFRGVLISGEEKLIKPDAAIFARFEARFGLSAAELFFIDDHQPNIVAAHQAGWDALRFERTDACYDAIRRKVGLAC